MKLWTNGVDTVIAVNAADALEVAVEFHGEDMRAELADWSWEPVATDTYCVSYDPNDDPAFHEKVQGARIQSLEQTSWAPGVRVTMLCDDWVRAMGRGWLGSTDA